MWMSSLCEWRDCFGGYWKNEGDFDTSGLQKGTNFKNKAKNKKNIITFTDLYMWMKLNWKLFLLWRIIAFS